jgi:hypothetical protein
MNVFEAVYHLTSSFKDYLVQFGRAEEVIHEQQPLLGLEG